MRSRSRVLWLALLLVVAFPVVTPDADAQIVLPFLFPPIADCGTVGVVPSFYDFDGDGLLDPCKVWFPDSGGGAYLVGGLDAYDEGDRVFVEGQICLTCLTTCPAGAILFATITPDCEK